MKEAPLSERSLIDAVIAAQRELDRHDRRAARSRTARRAAIRAAIDGAVSDRAIAIVTNMARSNIYFVLKAVDEPANDRLPVEYLGVHAINARYPCCGREARFARDEAVEPMSTVARYCRHCRIGYAVSREPIANTPRGRVDELVWSQATPD